MTIIRPFQREALNGIFKEIKIEDMSEFYRLEEYLKVSDKAFVRHLDWNLRVAAMNEAYSGILGKYKECCDG